MYQNFNWKWNNLVFVGRLLTSSLFFMYVGSLPFLLESWNLTASAAGLIQTAIVAGFALSLFLSSYLCDYYNPNKILIICSTPWIELIEFNLSFRNDRNDKKA